MATHSSVLAWRIPWTEEPGGLQSKGSQRVRRDWSNLACTHARKLREIKRKNLVEVMFCINKKDTCTNVCVFQSLCHRAIQYFTSVSLHFLTKQETYWRSNSISCREPNLCSHTNCLLYQSIMIKNLSFGTRQLGFKSLLWHLSLNKFGQIT